MEPSDIKKGQVWTAKKPSRPDITVNGINEFNGTVYWIQEGFESHIFDAPFEAFISQFNPPVTVEEKKNPDLIDEDEDDDLGLIF